MKYTTEKIEGSKVRFTVSLDAKEWDAANVEAYNKHKGKYAVQGFRKGHVPKKVLENMYGKGVFFEEAFDLALTRYYGEVLDKEQAVFPVAQPDIDVKDLNDDGVTFTAEVAVRPELKLPDLKRIKAEKIEYNVTDDDVKAELSQAQERASRLKTVEGRAIATGDTVTLDYSGSVKGKKFEGGTAEKQTLEIGSGRFIPGFEEQLVGLNIGDAKDLNVKFPEDYHKELAGKDAVFAVKIHEIKVKEVPALTDEFAKDVSEFDTLADYKADIKKKLTEKNDTKSRQELENALVAELAKLSEGEIPEALVDRQIDEMVQEMEYRLMYQGMKMEDYLKYTKSTMETLRKSYRDRAAESAKVGVVLEQLVRDRELTASEDEVAAKIKEAADKAKKSEEQYKKDMGRQLDYIKNEIVMDKVLKLLNENAQVTAKKADKADKAEKAEKKPAAEKKAAAEAKPAAEKKPAAKKTTK